MKYVENNLMKDENIIYKAKLSFLPIIENLILAIILIIIGFIFPINVDRINATVAIIVMIYLIIFVIAIEKLLSYLISYFTTELVITNKRLIGKKGLINIKTLDAPLDKITTVSISKGLFGILFNYGNLKIKVFTDEYKYELLENPEKFKNELMNMTSK